jgi:anaerobic ribonucleoside-triphosphate reductase activating protein
MDTWNKDTKRTMKIMGILAWCKSVAKDGFDGVTISGGEPFDQPSGLSALLSSLIQWRTESKSEFDILCYSGYPLRTLESKHSKIIQMLDAIIPEPYIESMPPTTLWCGSANQKVVPISERGRQIYSTYIDQPLSENGKQMQMSVDGKQIWMIGIPGRGDMEKLEVICQTRGISLNQVSWRR